MKTILFTLLMNVPYWAWAQINSSSASIPFNGHGLHYQVQVRYPSNLPTGGQFGNSQDAADAYNTWKINYIDTCTGSSSPTRYRVKYDNPSETVSEGIGYGMLLAAYAADKSLFDGLWAYYQDFSNTNGLMNWKTGDCANTIGTGGATDADLDVAAALVVAARQWATDSSVHNYRQDAMDMIDRIKTYEIQRPTDAGAYQTNNGDQWGFSNTCRNPSYQSPAYYALFNAFLSPQITPVPQGEYWDSVVNASYDLLMANADANTGLVSNWSDENGVPNSCNGANEYGWDACRHPWRMAIAKSWWFQGADVDTLLSRISNYLRQTGTTNWKAPVATSGGVGSYHSPAFVSTWATATMAANAPQSLVDSAYTETVNTQDNPPYYFGNTLRVLALFYMTGNFWNPMPIPTNINSLESNNNGGFSVFPNPMSDVFYIQAQDAAMGIYHLHLYNALGQLVWTKENAAIGSNPMSIDFSNKLAAGIYVLEVRNAQQQRVATMKLAKQ